MTDKPEKSDLGNMSANDFFDGESNNPATAQANPADDIGDQLKEGLRQAGIQAGGNFIIQTIIDLLPLPYTHKRNLTSKIQRGEPITIVDILFGGLSAGRIIRSVIGLIIFAIVVFIMASRGLT